MGAKMAKEKLSPNTIKMIQEEYRESLFRKIEEMTSSHTLKGGVS